MTPPMADSFGRSVDSVASSVSNVIKTWPGPVTRSSDTLSAAQAAASAATRPARSSVCSRTTRRGVSAIFVLVWGERLGIGGSLRIRIDEAGMSVKVEAGDKGQH